MTREKLVQYRGGTLVSETIEALRQLEIKISKLGNLDLEIEAPQRSEMSWEGVEYSPGPTGLPPHLSLKSTGREVYVNLAFKEDPYSDTKTLKAREVALLWGLMIPLGFTPWDRYPVESPTSKVFHFLGDWVQLQDNLLGDGRGEYALPSLAAACQLDVGTWGGDRPTERFVQSQLHRIGYNPGPVDGVIQDRTLNTVKATGLHGISLKTLKDRLSDRETVTAKQISSSTGHLVVPAKKFNISSYGGVKSQRTPTGATLTIDGPGRVILDVEE